MGQQGTNPVSDVAKKGRTESVKAISLLGALGSWAAVLAYLFARMQTTDPRYYTLVVIGTIMAIALSIANFLANRSKINWAIWLSVFATEISFIAISFTVATLGIILAIILLIIISNLAFQSLTVRMARFAIATGIVASVATLLVDVLSLNPLRIMPPDWLAEITIVAGGILILILGIQLLRHYQFNNIHTQIIVAFAIISVVPLWTVAAPQLIAISSSLQAAANQALSNSATDISKDFDEVLTHLKDNNTSDAKLPVLVKFARDGIGTSEDILEYFQIMKKRNSNILSYNLLDKNGKILVDTRTVPTSIDEHTADFQSAAQYQLSSISDISFDDAVNKHVFYISSPILNGNDDVSGVLRVEIDADLFQTELKAAIQGTDVTVILIDQDGIILANSSSPETRFKSIAPLNQERLTAFQQKHILSSGTAENLTVGLSDLEKGLAQSSPSFRAILIPNGSEVNAVTQRGLASNKFWRVVVGRPVSSFAEPVNIQTSVIILIATIVMLLALVAVEILSNLLTLPLKSLLTMSEHIRRGELDVPVKFERDDEIGQLSETLNAITIELRHNLEMLDNRVKERTADLETTVEYIGQRADQLRSVAEITRAITSIQNLDELLLEVTRQISVVLGFYHVGIFLTDQTGQFAILQASNSAGGQKMLQQNHRIRVGQAGIVSFAISSGHPRIALNVGDDSTFFNNPDLPDARSEIALPLRIGENIIGVLDLQSKDAATFGAEDIGVLNLLADQISIAIQNARLLEETRAALAEAQVFYRQSATASWREVLRQGTRGYRYLNGSIEAVKAVGETPTKITGGNASDPELLTIPINIRGKSLGVLNIRQTGRSQSWSNSEIHIYQSIVDRISFALENARLYQDAQRRASKERVISEISTKVSSSVNMDNILQAAVEELGRVLPGSEVVIQFEQEEDETGA